MPNLGVMFKTVSACNLACSYCYYPKEMTGRNENKVVPLETLDKFFSGYMQYIDGVAAISWQGGEPLAAGLKFFEEVVGLEKKYARKGTVIFNALQTNGTLIDDQWADFFRRYNFLIGVSLDGPQAIHDQDRMDITGKGSFKRVLRGIETLQGHRVPFNILCVVKKETVLHAREILRYFRECGFSYLQFIPCMNFTSDHSQSPAEYNITPEEYGRFL
ncbi:MAG: radical SAM protein [Firmicutes bacterium]|nr:radical SAM protein [Bacillota bacterium]